MCMRNSSISALVVLKKHPVEDCLGNRFRYLSDAVLADGSGVIKPDVPTSSSFLPHHRDIYVQL